MSRTGSFRRDFLSDLSKRGSFVLAACSIALGRDSTGADTQQREKDVSPVEDLMREHGLLKRVLLVYRDAIAKFDARTPPPADAISDAANIIRRFIEAYHEKLEEEHLFPRFRKSRVLVELVDVLENQHRKGRALTAQILKLSSTPATAGTAATRNLADAMHRFVRMYEPHEAREDTVLFPAFRNLVPDREYDRMGEQFEEKEHELFGADGFEKMVAEVAAIEKRLGIYDLGTFTPR